LNPFKSEPKNCVKNGSRTSGRENHVKNDSQSSEPQSCI